jgi:tRNA(Leu) C34 or U34 (ribose-2'-O)-methylase TrmL
MPAWENWHFNVDVSDPLQLPDPIFVLSPEDGVKIQGTVSLYDLVHPIQATYFFGNDSANLNLGHLEGRDFTAVYIPDTGHLHSFEAASMVIYDRKRKLWQS